MELINFNNPAFLSPDTENRLRTVYEGSFPESERRSWQSIKELSSVSRLNALAVVHEGEVAGLVTIWKFSDADALPWIYIEHLALSPEYRGRGIGSEVIEEIKRAYSLPVVLEAEPSGSTPEADARLRFYKRSGFRVHEDFSYSQPPYAPGMPWVALTLISHGLPPEISLREISDTLHREVYAIRPRQEQAPASDGEGKE